MKSEEIDKIVSNILADERFKLTFECILLCSLSPRFSSADLGDLVRQSLKLYVA